ncbi:MAG: beta-propeller domain-containing protein [Candidatus Anstonellaceae archaeon]
MVKIMNKFTVAAVLAALLLIVGCLGSEKNTPSPNVLPTGNRTAPLYTFSSWDEISDLLRLSSGSGFAGAVPIRDMRTTTSREGEITSASSVQKESAERYSQTNVQVEGVDEADIVKNDGKYIYAVYNSYSDFGIGTVWFYGAFGKVAIVEAYPPENMKKVGQINIEDASVHEIFVSKDKLVVFGRKESQYFRPMPVVGCQRCILPPIYYQPLSFVRVYDISDKTAPKLEKEVEVKGEYFDSRMIQNKVYAIFRDYPTYYDPVPFYRVDGVGKKAEPQEIAYFDMPSANYVYHHFFEIDLQNLQAEKKHKIIMLGYGQTLYVSSENIYLASTEYRFYSPEEEVALELIYEMLSAQEKEEIDRIEKQNVSSWQRQLAKREAIIAAGKKIIPKMDESERRRFSERYEEKMKNIAREWRSESTKIYKISLSGFEPVAWGEVPGSLINQFAMDESGQYLRVATTKNAPVSSSGLYVLDGGLKVVGKTEGIAPGESIYSVRFAGNKVYLVTFKKIDPFFVIDLSDPNEPKVQGKLKIPGYSTYLHEYDEKHVIGIGKEAIEAREGDFAWQQGVKLSLFDVSNPQEPAEIAKFQIGDRGTESYALTDHKAFLFDKERDLLVIPVLVAEIDEERYGGEVPLHAYGDYVFQGAYVFEVSPTKGFVLLGRISHASQEELLKSGSYFISDAEVKRSLYMDEYLYTVSDRMIKANRLPTLEEVAAVQLQKS